MSDSELSSLDKLLLTATSYCNDDVNDNKNDNVRLNEDESFLAKIAANDLKVLENLPSVNTSSSNVSFSKTKTTKASKLSLVHNGDTDSSDDESRRDFQNSKYNEFGLDIKHLLPEAKSNDFQRDGKSTTWHPKRETLKQNVSASTSSSNFDKVISDPFFGIRISKPLISSAALREGMAGRQPVLMCQVKHFVATIEKGQDWVIAGVIVQKGITKTSQAGAQYISWVLSDLHRDLKSISLLLFKDAYKKLWKTDVGTVVGILNPNILQNRDDSKQATLSIYNSENAKIFGQSKDFGLCKSRKKNGDSCTAFVNTNVCSYCIYHVKTEHKKFSLRADLQSKFAGGGLFSWNKHMASKNGIVHPTGNPYVSAVPAIKSKKLMEKDNSILAKLSGKQLVTSVPVKQPKKRVATSHDISRKQRLKDLELIKKLNGSSDVTFGLESKKNFDSSAISSEVNIDESRETALSIIAKLKSKKCITSENISNDEEVTKNNDNSNNKLKHIILNSANNNFGNNPKLSDPNNKMVKAAVIFNKESKQLHIVNDCITSKKENIEINDESNKNDIKTQENEDNIAGKNKMISKNKSSTVNESNTNILKSNDTNSETKRSIITTGSKNVIHSSQKENKTVQKEISNVSQAEEKLKDKNASESSIDFSKLKMLSHLNSTSAPTLSNTRTIDLSAPITKTLNNRAKMNALNWVQKNGPIKKDESKKIGVKRFLEESESSETKKSKMEEKIEFSDRFKKIMAMNSKHTDLLEQRDLEAQEKYFNKLEIREQMEEKMQTTYKIKCKAVKCLKCKYTSFSAAEKCKLERHPLKVFDSFKRFFECSDCGNRTVALEICPLFSCKQCGSSKWRRTTMMKEKKVRVGEALSICGGEQTFISSVQTDSNINLLVPDND